MAQAYSPRRRPRPSAGGGKGAGHDKDINRAVTLWVPAGRRAVSHGQRLGRAEHASSDGLWHRILRHKPDLPGPTKIVKMRRTRHGRPIPSIAAASSWTRRAIRR
jgi:hypothetical protein